MGIAGRLLSASLLVFFAPWVEANAADLATLTNGQGDGRVTISVDAYGSFGTVTGGAGAAFDPPGPLPKSSTVYASTLYFSGESSFFNAFPRIPVVQDSARVASSEFNVGGRFSVKLRQVLLQASPSGSTLFQQYTITNTSGVRQTLNVTRLLEGDLTYSGATSDDFGGVSGDLNRLYQFEQGRSAQTYLGVQSFGGVPKGFTIQQSGFYSAILSAQGIPYYFRYQLFSDDNGNRITDAGGDIGLALQQELTIPTGAARSFFAKTVFGGGSEGEPNTIYGSLQRNGRPPVTGTEVVVRQPSKSVTVKTNELGSYSAEGLIAGEDFRIVGGPVNAP